MKLQNCKQILFKWILETGMMQHICAQPDDFCMDDFFLNLFKQINSVGNIPKLTSLCDQNLVEVLRIFTNHSHISKTTLNDAYALSPIEYSYLYFLLLHFSYVKYTTTFCEKLCKKLSLESKKIIAKFMTALYYCPSVTRQAIRDAIIAITFFHSPAHHLFVSHMDLPTGNCMDFELPFKMFKLNTDRVKSKLYDLKAELFSSLNKSDFSKIENPENHNESPLLTFKKYGNQIYLDKEESKQVSQLLVENIFPKEKNKRPDIVKTLGEEKSLIQNKKQLYYGEQQVFCMKKLRDFDNKLTEVREELKHKDETIEHLSDKKDKLEQILTKVLSISNGASVHPRICADYLGRSNSETENLNLKKELQAMQLEKTKLKRKMQHLTQKYTQEWIKNIEKSSLTTYENATSAEELEHETLTDSFEALTNCVDKLNYLYKKEKIKNKRLKQNNFEVENRNKSLCDRLLLLENEIEEINAFVNNIEKIHKSNEQCLPEIANCKSHIKSLVEKNDDLTTKLSSLKNEYEETKLNADDTEQNFISIIDSLQKNQEEYQELNLNLIHENNELQRSINLLNDKLKFDKSKLIDEHLMAKIKSTEKNLETLHCSYKKLEGKNIELQIICDTLNEQLKLKSTEYRFNIETFLKRLSDQNGEIEDHIATELSVKEKHEKLLVQYEDIKRELRKSEKQIETVKNDVAQKEKRVFDLTNEVDLMRRKNAGLRAKINQNIQKQKHEKKTVDLTLKKKEKQIKELQNEKEQFEKLLQMVQKDNDDIQKEVKKLTKQPSYFCKEIETIWEMLKQGDDHYVELLFKETPTERYMDADIQCIFDKYLIGIKLNLKELLDFKTAAVEKIKGLELKQNERMAQLKDELEKFQYISRDKEQIIKSYENIVLESKKETAFLADKVKDYECKMKDLKLGERMFLDIVEKKLSGNLADTLSRLTDHKDPEELKLKFNHYEKKVQLLLKENTQLGEEIIKFKTSQLSNQTANQHELDAKLQNSENRCKELEEKLKCTNSTENAKEISLLNSKTDELTKQIDKLKGELEAAVEQKEIALTKSEIVAAQLQHVQEEKAVILKSLENTTEQLKLSVEHTNALEKLCIELREKVNEANGLNEKLQNVEIDFQTQCEQLKSERSDMQNRITALMRKVAEQTEALELNNTELITIIDTLEEKLTAIAISGKVSPDVEHVFDIIQTDDRHNTPHFSELKLILNKIMEFISKMKADTDANQEALEYMEVLEKCNTELENKLNQNMAKTYVLQETLAGEAKMSKEGLKNIEKIHGNLIAENKTFKLKLAEYEIEIGNLKTEIKTLFQKQHKQEKSENFFRGIVDNLAIKEKKLREKLKYKQSMYKELQEIYTTQQRDINEKSSIIQNLQKELNETVEQNAQIRAHMEQVQLELSLNDNHIKVLNEKCRYILESNTCPTENDLSIQSGDSVGLQAKIVQLACVRNNLTKCIFVYKRYMKNATKKKSK